MSVSVTFNGALYIIPTNNDVGWGTNLTNYLVAIAAGSLQKTGGTFLLSAELDFGAAFGIKALYYKSRTTNIADAGILRLANNGDSIAWRNAANSGNHLLAVNSSDLLTFDGVPVAVGGSGTVLTGVANTLAYYPASTNTVDDLPAITAARALVSDVNGLPVASVTTTAELAFVSGVTSAIQTQLNAKTSTTLTSAHLFVGNGSNVATDTAITGDVVISNAGVTSISSGVIVNADINASAAIDATKIADGSVSNTEFQFLDGVTSAIQTQINTKATDSLVVHLAGTETVTGSKTFSSTSGNPIHGNDAATGVAAGYIGEYITANGAANFPASNTTGDVASITLTAGDWDIAASILITPGSSDSLYRIGISTISGNSFTGGGLADGLNTFKCPGAASGSNQSLYVPRYRAQPSVTTTYYFKYNATYAGTTPSMNGYFSARRMT